MNIEQIGKIICQKREEKQMTQKDLADKLCVSDKTISRWETGNSIPDIDYTIKLCQILKINVKKLLETGNNKLNKKNNLFRIKNIFSKIISNWFNVCNFLITILSIIITYVSLDTSGMKLFNSIQFKEIIIFILLVIGVVFFIIILIKFVSFLISKNFNDI